MEIRFDTCKGKAVITIEDEKIDVSMDKDNKIYIKINEELEKGFIELKDFKSSGIPGKMKYHRNYKYAKDIITLLRSFTREYKVYNIIFTRKIENKDYNILEIDELILKEIMSDKSCIREFEDRYEYCIIKEYENKYKDFRIDIVQFKQVFIKFVMIEEEKVIVSINFSKDIFNISNMVDWIKYNEIKIFNNDDKYVKDVDKVFEGIKFKDNTILFYSKGIRDILINRSQLSEVSETFFTDKDTTNIFHSNSVEFNKTDMKIILNGKRIDYIPEIEIQSEVDLIFCNGLMIEAKYIGNHDNSIGFFKNKTCKDPMASILHTSEPIYIKSRFSDGTGIIFLEYNAGFSIDDFF